MKTRVGAQSDHSLIQVQLHALKRRRGRRLWKLNPSLLQNECYVKLMDFLEAWTDPSELANPCSKWEWLKHEIKRKSIEFSRDNVPVEKQMLRDLSKELKVLTLRADKGEDVEDQITSVRREIAEVEELRANNLILRARTSWAHLGEKPSAFYLDLEKRASTLYYARLRSRARLIVMDSWWPWSFPRPLTRCRGIT